MKKITKDDSKCGFTIVELTLTMAFIAMLLIAIAVITTNILAIYQKGTTLKAVNNVGRDLIDSFSNSLTKNSSFNVTSNCRKVESGAKECGEDNGFKGFVFNERRDDAGNQLYGVFCTGSYSYIWNTDYILRDDSVTGLTLTYTDIDGNTQDLGNNGNKIALARILDSRRRVCSATIDKKYNSIFSDDKINIAVDITHPIDNDSEKIKTETPEDGLLEGNNVDLALYELTVFPYSNDKSSGHNFYAGTFILGTRRGDVNIQSSNEFCRNSSASLYGDGSETSGSLGNLGAEFNYCAINKFNFAVRSAGGE